MAGSGIYQMTETWRPELSSYEGVQHAGVRAGTNSGNRSHDDPDRGSNPRYSRQ